jgi:hypothetical protein
LEINETKLEYLFHIAGKGLDGKQKPYLTRCEVGFR